MTNFTIKIISDNICPFCYVGKVRLSNAISLFRKTVPNAASDTFNISWHAYYLNPNPSAQSEPVQVATARKFGAERVPMIQARIKQVGVSEGLDFTFAGRTGSTRDSHRVVQLGKTKGNDMENNIVHEIMRMYFEEGGDITAEEDLVKAAEKAGVGAEETRAWLREGKGGEVVDKEVEEAYEMGVTGVPHFVINDKFEVHGAEDVSVFVEQLTKAKKAAA